MAVRGFIVAGVLALHAPDGTVVDDAIPLDGVVVVLVRDRQRVEGLVYLRAELILRVVHQERSQGVTAVGECLLCLCRQCGTRQQEE